MSNTGGSWISTPTPVIPESKLFYSHLVLEETHLAPPPRVLSDTVALRSCRIRNRKDSHQQGGCSSIQCAKKVYRNVNEKRGYSCAVIHLVVTECKLHSCKDDTSQNAFFSYIIKANAWRRLSLLNHRETSHLQNGAHSPLVLGLSAEFNVSVFTPGATPRVLDQKVGFLCLQVRTVSYRQDTVINGSAVAARVIRDDTGLVKLKDKLVSLDRNTNGLHGNGRQESHFVAGRHVNKRRDLGARNICAVGPEKKRTSRR